MYIYIYYLCIYFILLIYLVIYLFIYFLYTKKFPKIRVPPNHPKLDRFGFESHGFGDPPFQETSRIGIGTW